MDVYAEIELINAVELELMHRRYIDEDKVKRIRVNARVDTAAVSLIIDENIRASLALPFLERRKHRLADDQFIECDVVGPVEIRFKTRKTTCRVMVLPGSAEPLLGMISLEAMNVLVDPLRKELIANPEHPDGAVPR